MVRFAVEDVRNATASGCGCLDDLNNLMQEQKSSEESSKALQDKEKELQKALKDAKVSLLLHTCKCLTPNLTPSVLMCSSCWHSKRHAVCGHGEMHINDEVLACTPVLECRVAGRHIAG